MKEVAGIRSIIIILIAYIWSIHTESPHTVRIQSTYSPHTSDIILKNNEIDLKRNAGRDHLKVRS